MMRGARSSSTPRPPRARAAPLRWSAAIAVHAVVAATSACSGPPRPPDTVVYASGADLESANPLVTVHPLSRQVQRYALFVTLARYDSALAPQPYYARAWDWSDGGATLTLALHHGLRWHDGTPTSARDVAFTIDAARDPATGYPRYADLATMRSVSAVDDTTVRITFSSAQPGFPPVLCELPILPAHLLDRVPRAEMRRAPFNVEPVGNGPFRFAVRDAGRRWVFERSRDFPESLGGAPAIARLVVAVVDEPTTKFAGLVSGELDIAGIAPTMASLAERDRAMRVLSYPVLFSTGIVFNSSRPPFDDVRVRRAISAAIDRPRIIEVALAGFATPARGAVPPESPYALEFDPHSARAADSLLDAAGWARGADRWRARGGRPLAFTLLTVGSGDNAVEQLVQADLRALGLRVDIRQLEFGAFLREARATPKQFDAIIAGVPGDLALSYLAAMFDSRLAGGALDYAGFHTSVLDSAFARVSAAATTDALRAGWHDVQRLLHESTPVAWIYHSRGVQGISSRLRGVTMDLRGEMATVARWHVAESRSR